MANPVAFVQRPLFSSRVFAVGCTCGQCFESSDQQKNANSAQHFSLGVVLILKRFSSLKKKQFAFHHETGEGLPGDRFDELCYQRTHLAGFKMLQMLNLAQVYT